MSGGGVRDALLGVKATVVGHLGLCGVFSNDPIEGPSER
jgi:hypothetical protein